MCPVPGTDRRCYAEYDDADGQIARFRFRTYNDGDRHLQQPVLFLQSVRRLRFRARRRVSEHARRLDCSGNFPLLGRVNDYVPVLFQRRRHRRLDHHIGPADAAVGLRM